MDVFPNYRLREFADVKPGTVCVIFRSGEPSIGLAVSHIHGGHGWIRFSKGLQGEAWTTLQIDPGSHESVLVFDDARLVVSFEPSALGTGACADAKLAGSAFLMEGKIAISGLINEQYATVFDVGDGTRVVSHHTSLPYFKSWTIEVRDGAVWRTVFSKSWNA
jgi:hypothetical protein